MKTRLASLFLLLALFGSAFAGVPIHFGESDCGIGMMDMECCQKAMLNEVTPEVADAKLCCALSCAQNGSTSPASSTRVTPPAPGRTVSSPALSQVLPVFSGQFRAFDRAHHTTGSPPTYLRNLTLLI